MAEFSKIGNLKERLVVVNHGWQSESTDGTKVIVISGVVAVVTSPTTAGCSVV